MARLLQWLRGRLIASPRVHLRQEAGTLVEAIEVVDRFLSDAPHYPLEWDDFISWESSNPTVETMRVEMAALEPLFHDGRQAEAAQELKIIRDRYALLIGR